MKKILFLSLLLLLSITYLSIKTNYLNKLYSIIATPTLYLGYYVSRPFVACNDYLRSHATLRKENKDLKEKLLQFQQHHVEVKALQAHFNHRSDIDTFLERYAVQDAHVCKIILKNLTPQEQFYYINKGSMAGIQKDMIATYKFQLLGKVIEIFPWYSKIQLITDSRSKIAAYTKEHKNKGIVSAHPEHGCIMQYINAHADIKPDDIVISSGQGMIFPEGFTIGTIVEMQQQDAYQNALIKPLIHVSSLDFCTVFSQEKIRSF